MNKLLMLLIAQAATITFKFYTLGKFLQFISNLMSNNPDSNPYIDKNNDTLLLLFITKVDNIYLINLQKSL